MEKSSPLKSSSLKLKIPILLGSCRTGRHSIKVANFILKELQQNEHILTELIDLCEYTLPLLEERLTDMENPSPHILDFCSKLGDADGILIVTPEYKHGYPGALKNALDYLEPQALRRKPIGICTVSAGGFGGLNCLAQLRLVCLALGGLPIPAQLPISRVQEVFDQGSELNDQTFLSKFKTFIQELMWYTEAMANQKQMSNVKES